jgi:hypothetical protein
MLEAFDEPPTFGLLVALSSAPKFHFTLGVQMSSSLAGMAATIYTFVLPVAWIVLAVNALIVLPMCVFKRLRPTAGLAFFMSSYLFGLTTWMLGAVVTFATMGWIGLLVGLMIAGVGVVPLGIFAAFVLLKEFSLGLSLIVMSILVFATRMGGFALMGAKSDVPEHARLA